MEMITISSKICLAVLSWSVKVLVFRVASQLLSRGCLLLRVLGGSQITCQVEGEMPQRKNIQGRLDDITPGQQILISKRRSTP